MTVVKSTSRRRGHRPGHTDGVRLQQAAGQSL